ncbi:MAG: hypothetical protein IKV25_04600 [Clostridia bacterium]|nr:hypothetical protein [Clostridia bacterium]
MIFYKPIENIDEIKMMFPQATFKYEVQYGVYVGIDEDGNQLGSCLMSMFGYKCYIEIIECDYSDKLLVEGFLRSALNFCANRNAYMAYCNLEEISDVLLHLGFENNDCVYSGDIPSLLKGSCCK